MKTFNQYIEEYFNTFPTQDLSPVVYGKNLDRMLNEEYELVPFELKIGLTLYVIKDINKLRNFDRIYLLDFISYTIYDNPSHQLFEVLKVIPQKFIDNLLCLKLK